MCGTVGTNAFLVLWLDRLGFAEIRQEQIPGIITCTKLHRNMQLIFGHSSMGAFDFPRMLDDTPPPTPMLLALYHIY